MKKTLVVILLCISSFYASAQNEGRIGVFAGMNKTTLLNAQDALFGDYLPTYKSSLGLQAGYHFTLFKALPMGISLQLANTKAGQDYQGAYADSTRYYAYSRLNYLRVGLALHFGTNPRRAVALEITGGYNYGFLTKYQERYELIRYNNDRYILDIKNTDVTVYDTSEVKGTLTSPMYNKLDMAAFGTVGLNFLLSTNWVFGFYGRFDIGFASVENTGKMNINYDTQPSTSSSFKIFNTAVKYHGPTDDLITHSTTTNLSYGVFLTLKYRIFNKEKIEFYYKENRKYNHD